MSNLPLIADCFAGGGGASTAIEQALGRSPDVAINHSDTALALHAANHPETEHLKTSIYAVDPRSLVKKGQRVGLAWFSPDCKHFSKAKGGAPLNKNIRDLAWTVVHWAELVRPEVIALENVEEFQTWAPLRQKHEGGRPTTITKMTADLWDRAPEEVKGKPVLNKDGTPYMEVDPLRKGETFREWVQALRKLGYKVAWRELRACDYGAPTIRKRLFLIARCDKRPIVWPDPTHGDPTSPEVKSGKLKPWRTAAECIDWSLPCPSIFDTKTEIKEKHGLTAVRPLAHNTQARIARGMKRYVLDAAQPYIVNLTHGARLEPTDAPLRTVTGANRGEKAIITPSVTRFNSGATGQDLREPLSTITANSFKKRPGGAAPLGLIAPHLMTMRNAQKPFNGANEPTHTITAGGAGLSMVAPALATYYGHTGGRGKRAADLNEPLRTVTVENRHALIVPHLLSLKGSNRRDSSALSPHPTVLAGGGHSAVIAPVLTYAQHGGRNRAVTDPHHTITASLKDQNAVFAPLLVQTGYGERSGQAPRALNPHAPLGTIVAGGIKHAPATAFLAQHNSARQGVHPGRPAQAPVSTLTASGSHQNVVASWFAKYYGTGDGAPQNDPMHTLTVKDRMGHVQAELSAPDFTLAHEARARQVAEFLRTHGAWDGGEFVTLTIDGQTYVVVDIGMRMLTPRELFNAQGFPPDYVIEGTWKQDGDNWTWNPFTKSTQVSCCGNSVSPHPARALIEANCTHLMTEQRKAA